VNDIQQPGRSLPGTAVHKTAQFNAIPPITDPLGKHWRMPDNIREVPMDDEFAWLTEQQVQQLPEYSSSYPSGHYYGKCWKRDDGNGGFWLCWYYPNPKPNTISIGSRIIIEKEKNK